MDLVQNLKKILIESGKIIFHGLYSHYIEPKEKPTTKKQDNSSPTMSSQNHLTTEHQGTTIATSSAGTSEKTTMNKMIEDPLVIARDWSIERIETLSSTDNGYDKLSALAIAEEFYEWIDIDENSGELEYLALEDSSWTKDQEIDTL